MKNCAAGRDVRGRLLAGWFSALLLAALALPVAGNKPHSFIVEGGRFLLDGKPFLIRSGELHYARIPREYWRDRLLKARAMGLNTVCTYVFWNFHEAEPGVFDFSGDRDLAGFIAEAGRVGLRVIVRPGPYVCSEWDFGGLPAWLLREPELRLRCREPRYMAAAERYLMRLGVEIGALQATRGGPIILLQLENEYGSYGNERGYLDDLLRIVRAAGFDVPLFTSDGPTPAMLEAGSLPGLPPLVNFGGDAGAAFTALERFRPGTPPACGEYWCGWFTHWGDAAWGTADAAAQGREIEWMLASGKSFNLYMFHGGSNFGFWAGANSRPGYAPDITSYDYDAPLDEAGRPTAKYYAWREIYRRHLERGERLPPLPAPLPAIDVAPIEFHEAASLLQSLPPPVADVQPRPMERYGQSYGLILYRTTLRGPRAGKLAIDAVHDYARIFLDGRFVGALDRRAGERSIELPATDSAAPRLDILVEAMGRINFGAALADAKGLRGPVTLNGVTLMAWQVFPLPLAEHDRNRLAYEANRPGDGPRVWRARFPLAQTGDTFLDLTGWKKGMVWVNGRHLGRYWDAGPQRDLFLPGVWLKRGENEIVVLELIAAAPAAVSGRRERRR